MIYKIQGLNADGQYAELEIEASGAEQAQLLARERGFVVLAASAMHVEWAVFRHRSTAFPLLMFTQEMLALLKAGLSIVEVMQTLLDKEQKPENRQVLSAVVGKLHEGCRLSAAFESQPQVFPDLYVASVHSSEKTGNLTEALERYVKYQGLVNQMRKKIISASIYPLLLMLVGGMVIVFLMLYVIPKFSHIYADSHADLPFASWVLLQWGKAVENHGDLILLTAAALLSILIYLLSLPQVRATLRALLWKMPGLGERIRVYQLARFFRTLSMLLAAGIPVIVAMERVIGLLDVTLRSRLQSAIETVRQGMPLSHALEQAGLSTVVALRLLKVGERSGQLAGMMDSIAEFHEEELNRWIDWASRLFEPLLMTAIGIVIGTIVVLMYMPIFELAGSLQ